MSEFQFARGPYREILPPPLLSHVTPEEAWKRYYAFNLSIGVKLDGPQNEAEKAVWYNLAAVYCHQIRLREVIGGRAKGEIPLETVLRQQVEAGEFLSMRPVGLESRNLKTYAPVLKRIGNTSWQFGTPDSNRSIILEAKAEEIIEKAQQLYVVWQQVESETPGEKHE